jgi:glycerophosphoryl diester phosphodiesterase
VIVLERRDGRPLRIGHRGAPTLAPENTLRSFRAALEAGVDIVEFDVLALEGGELVVAHSGDLREITHGAAAGNVDARTLEELRELAPELPTFDEVLEFFANDALDVGLHVDIKSVDALETVTAALRHFGLADRTLASTSNRAALRRLRRLEPAVRTGLTFPPGSSALAPLAGAGLPVIRWTTSSLVAGLLARSEATALVLHHLVVTERAVRRTHALGAAVVAWTVDDPGDLARMDVAGVDAVVTNDPRIFASTLPS